MQTFNGKTLGDFQSDIDYHQLHPHVAMVVSPLTMSALIAALREARGIAERAVAFRDNPNWEADRKLIQSWTAPPAPRQE